MGAGEGSSWSAERSSTPLQEHTHKEERHAHFTAWHDAMSTDTGYSNSVAI